MKSLLRLLASVALVVGLVATAAGPASAALIDGTGRVGRVGMPPVIGSHTANCIPVKMPSYNAYTGTTSYYTISSCAWNPSLHFANARAYRPAGVAARLNVSWTIKIQRYEFGWSDYITLSSWATLPRGYSSTVLPGRWTVPNKAGSFRVRHYVTWRNASTGRVVGTKRLRMYHLGDYTCQTRFATCVPNAGFIHMRAPGY